MNPATHRPTVVAPDRTPWVDVAKALCILLVVMMHSTLGYQNAVGQSGFLDPVVAFFQPFRVPTFFLLSGLFLERALRRDFGGYARTRLFHFGYFYLLWLVIHVIVRNGPRLFADPYAVAQELLLALVEPYDTLWFLHLLMVFSLVAYVLRLVNPLTVLAASVVLHLLRVETGSTLLDEFAGRAVFFAAGWALGPMFFALARLAAGSPWIAAGAVAAFAASNAGLLFLTPAASHALGLILGLAGAAAMTIVAALLAVRPILGTGLAALGRQSLTIYVAFTLPMAALRLAFLKIDFLVDGWLAVGLGSLVVTIGAVAAPLLVERLVRGSVFGLLFERGGSVAATREKAVHG